MDALVPDPKNPRTHGRDQLKKLCASIRAFGFNVPLLVDRNSQIIAGHGRWLAARQLKFGEVPIIRLEHLSDAQRQAFVIADNRLTDLSSWDDRLLAESLKGLSEVGLDFEIEAIGFEMGEIDLRIGSLDPWGEGDDPADDLPGPPEGPPVSLVGDVWELGQHRVICGDALDKAAYRALLGKARASIIFTDPPYNVAIAGNVSGNGRTTHREFAMASGEMGKGAFTDFLTRSLTLAGEHSGQGTLAFVCMDWRHINEIVAAGNAAFSDLKNLCVWTKSNAGMGSLYRSQHELIFVFKNGTAPHRNNVQLGRFGRNRSNVLAYPTPTSFGRSADGEGNLLELHPTVKPVSLVADAIMDASARSEIVLDPFLGSGTTVIAAERTGRRCYGVEIDPVYVDTIVKRWERFTKQKARHSSGAAFEEVAAKRGANP